MWKYTPTQKRRNLAVKDTMNHDGSDFISMIQGARPAHDS